MSYPLKPKIMKLVSAPVRRLLTQQNLSKILMSRLFLEKPRPHQNPLAMRQRLLCTMTSIFRVLRCQSTRTVNRHNPEYCGCQHASAQLFENRGRMFQLLWLLFQSNFWISIYSQRERTVSNGTKQWNKAIWSKMDFLCKNNTWSLVAKLKAQNMLTTISVFKINDAIYAVTRNMQNWKLICLPVALNKSEVWSTTRLFFNFQIYHFKAFHFYCLWWWTWVVSIGCKNRPFKWCSTRRYIYEAATEVR